MHFHVHLNKILYSESALTGKKLLNIHQCCFWFLCFLQFSLVNVGGNFWLSM